jgi:hypothetical protein
MIIHGTFVIKHCKFLNWNEKNYSFSFKLKIWDDNRFGSAKISSKCNVREQVLRNCKTKNSEW